MITGDLRHAIAQAVAAEGFPPADPGLRPGGGPGRFSSSVAFVLAAGREPVDVARLLASRLAGHPWLARAEACGPGFLALTVSQAALAALPGRITAAGPACARSDALRDVALAAPPPADLRAASGWEEARQELAAELTARLAAAAGAKVTALDHPERMVPAPHQEEPPPGGDVGAAIYLSRGSGIGPDLSREVAAAIDLSRGSGIGQDLSWEVAAAIDYAGEETVRFWLARTAPGRAVRPDAATMARHAPDNPAYAVRYAHARAASGVRWAAISAAEADPRRPPSDPGELALLDALSWLPERVAVAARRGRPDEFARYLEEVASVTIATLSSSAPPGSARAPGSGRLALAGAAQAGLAAGLDLLGVSAPDRM